METEIKCFIWNQFSVEAANYSIRFSATTVVTERNPLNLDKEQLSKNCKTGKISLLKVNFNFFKV